MSKLKAVAPKTAKPSKPKILIFGKPGVGKTWASPEFPSVYYIDSEGGANFEHYTDKLHASGGVYFGPEQGSREFAAVLEEVKTLGSEKHPYRTVVIDSISELYQMEIAKETERLTKAGKPTDYGANKKPAIAFSRELHRWLKKGDLNAILIAHQNELYEGGEASGVTFDAWEKFEYLFDLTLHIFKVGDKRRAKVVKSRLIGFPDSSTFDWSYEEFASRYGKAVIERESEVLALATPEQLEQIKQLLEIYKLPEPTKERWFGTAEVSEWSEMTTDQIEACIVSIREKVTPTKKETAA